jgi:hypothetical protein
MDSWMKILANVPDTVCLDSKKKVFAEKLVSVGLYPEMYSVYTFSEIPNVVNHHCHRCKLSSSEACLLEFTINLSRQNIKITSEKQASRITSPPRDE